MTARTTNHRNARGAALIIAMVLSVICVGLALSFLVITHSQTYHLGHSMRNERAFSTAESGITMAMHLINLNSEQGGTVLTMTPTTNANQFVVTNADGSGISDSMGDEGSFTVTITYDQVEDIYTVTSTGTFMDKTRVIEVGLAGQNDSPFTVGLFAKEILTGNGTVFTDSYNSVAGDYDSQVSTRSVTFANGQSTDITFARTHGDIGSNGDLILIGQPTIMGSALSGPNGDYTASSDTTVFGSAGETAQEVDLPSPDITITTVTDPLTGAVLSASGSASVGDTYEASHPVLTVVDLDTSGGGPKETPKEEGAGGTGSSSSGTGGTGTGTTGNGNGTATTGGATTGNSDNSNGNSGGTGANGGSQVGTGNTNTGGDTTTSTGNGNGGGDHSTEVALGSGNYYATNVDISGGGTLHITGDVVLYVDGDFNISGNGGLTIDEGASLVIYQKSGALKLDGTLNNGNTGSDDASTLQMYSAGTSVSFNGGGNASQQNMIASLYAPDATLSMNSANLFGSFIAQTIDNRGNSSFHYDEKLGTLGGYGDVIYVQTYWILKS